MPKHKKSFDVEKHVCLTVLVQKKKYIVTTSGLSKFERPELKMQVTDGMYLAAACSILNDAARHFIDKDVVPRNGTALQIGSHIAVRFKGSKSPLEVTDASELLESLHGTI